MNKTERAKFIVNFLEDLYPRTPIPLKHHNLFQLLIAVLLSAQCTDERVNKVTPLLFKYASNPKKMQAMPVEKIYEIIRPCGLAPQKSKAISLLSTILVQKFQSNVPESFEPLILESGILRT